MDSVVDNMVRICMEYSPGETTMIHAAMTDTMADLLKLLNVKVPLPEDKICALQSEIGDILDDHRTVADYNIQDLDMLSLIVMPDDVMMEAALNIAFEDMFGEIGDDEVVPGDILEALLPTEVPEEVE